MKETIGSLNLQWQDRPEGADAQYRQFLAVQRRRREPDPARPEGRPVAIAVTPSVLLRPAGVSGRTLNAAGAALLPAEPA